MEERTDVGTTRMMDRFRARALPAQSVLGAASEEATEAPSEVARGVALTARAPDSKSGGWGFESLHPCHFVREVESR